MDDIPKKRPLEASEKGTPTKRPRISEPCSASQASGDVSQAASKPVAENGTKESESEPAAQVEGLPQVKPELKDKKEEVTSNTGTASETIMATTVQTKIVESKGSNEKQEDGTDEEAVEDDDKIDIAAIREHEYQVVSKFSPAQMERYEHYRRSDLKKEKVKKVLIALNPSLAKASDQYLLAVKGLAKVFVGDVVEHALEIQRQWKESGALQPKHIREAYRILRRDGVLPSNTLQRSVLD